jgi:hypothetical protein
MIHQFKSSQKSEYWHEIKGNKYITVRVCELELLVMTRKIALLRPSIKT